MKMKTYPKLRGYAAGGVVEEEPYGVRAARAVRSGLGQVLDAAAPVIEKANDYITAPPRAIMKFGSDFANEYWGGRESPASVTPLQQSLNSEGD